MNPMVHSITMYSINNATLRQWYGKRTKIHDKLMLERKIRLPEPPMSDSAKIPPAEVRVPITDRPPVPLDEQHVLNLPPCTVGISGRVRKNVFPPQPVESPANPDSEVQMVPLQSRPVQTSEGYLLQLPQKPFISQQVQPQSSLARSTERYRRQQEKKMQQESMIDLIVKVDVTVCTHVISV